MAKFLFLYRSGKDSRDTMTPDEMQQSLKKWQSWVAEGLRNGWMRDTGDRLTQEGRVVNAKKVVTDGPFVEAKDVIGGFSIVQADTLDAAAELAKGCPVFLVGGTVEVRPLAGFTMEE
jgi:hypothetical protein